MSEEHPEPKPSLLGRLTALWSNNEEPDFHDAFHELIAQACTNGVIGEETAQMLERLTTLDDTRVRDIMIPRGQILLIEEDWSLEQIFNVIIESGHSRYPVVDETHEQIRGILLSKDLLPYAFRQQLPRDTATSPALSPSKTSSKKSSAKSMTNTTKSPTLPSAPTATAATR